MRLIPTAIALFAVGLLNGCNLLPMPPGGIRGTVLNGQTPVANAVVQATVIGEDSFNNWISGRPSNQATTKPDGTYYLDNLHPGNFTVTVNWNGKELAKQATIKSGNDTFVNFDMAQATASAN